MYHGGFQKAKNFKGKLYRNQQTGDMEQYCEHSYLLTPEFEFVDEHIADGAFSYSRKIFTGFEGTCKLCGEVLHISSENVLSETDYAKKVEERVVEIEKEDNSKVRGKK